MSDNSDRQFQPSLISTIVVAIVVVISLFLSYWQIGRIDEKKALQVNYEKMLKADPLNLNILKSKDFQLLSSKQWQPVSVSGTFLSEHQFLLDSQVYNDKPGYNAIVPLLINGSDTAILINRGWIPAGNDRQQIPNIPALSEKQPIRGQLANPKLVMPGFDTQNINEQVQLFIDMQALSDRIAAPLAPMIIQLDERSIGPLPRKWPKYQAKVEMHEFYVMHWLVVALFSILLFIYFAYKPKKQKPKKIKS
jgi:surfeit locus 1 family protein